MNNSGNFIKIKQGDSWVDIVDPQYGSGSFTIATTVTEARNAKNNFVGATVGQDKYKVELAWSVLPADQAALLFSRFDRSRGGKFINTFRVYDARTNDWVTLKMYVSDRTGSPMMMNNGSARYVTDVRVALIEV